MSSGGTGDRGEHRGLVYRGHGHLLVCTVAVVRAALDQGHRVVVGLDRPAGRALDAALGDVLDRPGTIAWTAPDGAPHHGSAAFAERLRSLVPPTGRLLVLEQYSTDGSGRRPSPELDRVLSSSPITLLCACPISSDPDVLRAFGDGHTLSASFLPGGRTGRGRPGPPVDGTPLPAPPPGVYETTLSGIGDLRELRSRLRRIAAGAGFTTAARDRAVLAFHEAATLACRSVGRAGEPAGTTRPAAGSACTLRLHTWPHRMEVEIDLPRSARFPADLRDADPLCHIRTFCREASWIGTLHPRRIRVVAQHEP